MIESFLSIFSIKEPLLPFVSLPTTQQVIGLFKLDDIRSGNCFFFYNFILFPFLLILLGFNGLLGITKENELLYDASQANLFKQDIKAALKTITELLLNRVSRWYILISVF